MSAAGLAFRSKHARGYRRYDVVDSGPIHSGSGIGKPGVKLTTKKSIAAKEIILKHSKDFNGALGDMEVMKLCGLARNTYYKYKKEMRG